MKLRNVFSKIFEYVIVFLIAGGVGTYALAHTNKFASLIVYGTSGINNAGALTQTGAATFSSNLLVSSDAAGNIGSASARVDAGYFDEIWFDKGDTVASATTSFTLGSDGNYYVISGTAQIDSIAVQSVGKMVILETAAACTLVDGGNLRLSANLNATADDIITLVTDGTDWYEVSRSAN